MIMSVISMVKEFSLAFNAKKYLVFKRGLWVIDLSTVVHFLVFTLGGVERNWFGSTIPPPARAIF